MTLSPSPDQPDTQSRLPDDDNCIATLIAHRVTEMRILFTQLNHQWCDDPQIPEWTYPYYATYHQRISDTLDTIMVIVRSKIDPTRRTQHPTKPFGAPHQAYHQGSFADYKNLYRDLVIQLITLSLDMLIDLRNERFCAQLDLCMRDIATHVGLMGDIAMICDDYPTV